MPELSKLFKLFLLSVCVLMQGSFAQAELIRGSAISFENWSGGGYTNDTTGAFSHCVVSANYLSGDTLHFSVTRDGSVGVGVTSPNLNLSPGSQFPVALYVDRREPIYGTANAADVNFATLFIPDLEKALNAFRRGRTLVIEGQGLRGEYDLAGTFRALDQVTNCAINFYSFMQAPDENQIISTNVETSFLYQIATRTITSFGITDFEFDDAETIAALGLGEQTVRWTASELGVAGTIIAVNHEIGTDIRSTDAVDIQYVASFCDDEFASTTRNLSEDGHQIREIRVLCVSPGQETEHYISKFLSGDLVIYTWFQFDGAATLPSGGNTQSEASNAAISAASFVLE
jgi:hypothetical protein